MPGSGAPGGTEGPFRRLWRIARNPRAWWAAHTTPQAQHRRRQQRAFRRDRRRVRRATFRHRIAEAEIDLTLLPRLVFIAGPLCLLIAIWLQPFTPALHWLWTGLLCLGSGMGYILSILQWRKWTTPPPPPPRDPREDYS